MQGIDSMAKRLKWFWTHVLAKVVIDDNTLMTKVKVMIWQGQGQSTRRTRRQWKTRWHRHGDNELMMASMASKYEGQASQYDDNKGVNGKSDMDKEAWNMTWHRRQWAKWYGSWTRTMCMVGEMAWWHRQSGQSVGIWPPNEPIDQFCGHLEMALIP